MASHRDHEPQDQAVGSVFQETITSDFFFFFFLFQAMNREAKPSLNCSRLSFGMFFPFLGIQQPYICMCCLRSLLINLSYFCKMLNSVIHNKTAHFQC